MRNFLLSTACAVALTLGCSAAQAADFEEPVVGSVWYVSLFGGASFLDEIEITYTDSTVPGISETRTDAGFIAGGAVGWYVNPNLRAEVEVSFFENQVNRLSYPNDPVDYSASGHINSLNVMANLWYGFDLGMGIVPYLGGGAGVGFVNGNAAWASPFDEFNGSDSGFAFQAGGGIMFDITQAVAFDLGYRYRGILNVNLPTEYPAQVNESTDIYGHFVQAGVVVNLDGW